MKSENKDMKRESITFSSDNIQFIKELRERVSQYLLSEKKSEYGNMKLVYKTVFMLILYLLPFTIMLSGVISSVWGVFMMWFLMGIGMAGVGMAVMHDANHKLYSKNHVFNKLMENTLYILGGFPVTWQYQHNSLHHGFTNIDGHDEDINPGSALRFSPHKPLLKIHKYQHIYAWFLYGLMTLMWVTNKDFKQLKRYSREGITLSNKWSVKQLWLILIISKVLYYFVFLIIPILILPVAWYWIVLGFLFMHFTCGFILTIIFQTAHVVPTSKFPLPDKEGKIEYNWAVNQLYTTSDFAHKNRILSWFIGGLNYQVEHHLFPNISHIHYRKLAVLVKETARKYNLPYHVQPSFFNALHQHGKMLKLLGSKMTI